MNKGKTLSIDRNKDREKAIKKAIKGRNPKTRKAEKKEKEKRKQEAKKKRRNQNKRACNTYTAQHLINFTKKLRKRF